VKFEVSRRAQKQIEKIGRWWVENRTDSPDLFLDELAKAEDLLRASPEMGTVYAEHKSGKVRRILLTKTQHHLYYRYRTERDELTVLMVWGTPKGRGPKL